MKTRLLGALLSWLSLLSFGARAQTTTLAVENFEDGTSGASPRYGYTTTGPIVTSAPYQYFERRAFDTPNSTSSTYPDADAALTTGSAATISSLYGLKLWTAEGVRGEVSTPTNRAAGVVQLRSIATSGYKNLRITVAFAAPRGGSYNGPGANEVQTTDRIRLQYSFNNGASWTTAGLLLGNNGTAGDFQQDTSTPLDSIPDGTILDQRLRDITASISGTGPALLVRIVASTRFPSFAFDNIRVTGDVDNVAKPTLSNLETTTLNYTEGSGPVQVTSALTVGFSDNSSTAITGATVSVSSNFVSGQDQLNFINQNGITGSYNTGNGILTLTSNSSVTQATYQAALRSITYSNSNTTTLATGTRQITFQVASSGQASNSPVRPVAIAQTLNAPATLNYTENFDADGEGLRYVSDTFYGASGPIGFFRATTNPASYNGSTVSKVTYTNLSGGFWYGEGNVSTANPKNPFSSLQLAPVDATGRTNLRFTVAIGAGGTWVNYINSSNVGDWFELFYSLDGGTTLTKFGAFYGADNESLPRQDADLDPTTPATGTQLNSALRDFTFSLPAAAAVGNLTFVLRQRARVDAEIAFDNIRIKGTVPPTVTTTTPVTSIQPTSATLGGTVTADGGGTLAERGVVYVAGTGTPTTSNTKAVVATSGIVVGTAYSGTVTGLAAATQYTARAYATNEAGTSYGASVTFTTATTITSIVRADPSPTNAAAVRFTVTFANAITGLSATNFAITSNGTIAGFGIATISGSGTTYIVTVNTGTGSGTQLRLDLANSTGLLPGVSNAPFTSGESYSIDKTAPAVAISSAAGASGSTTTTTPIPFTVTFSESVTGFVQGDLTVSNGTVAGFTGSGATYTFNVAPMANGAVTVNIPANVAQDAATNSNTAASQFSLTYRQPLVATAQNVTVNLAANGTATLNASSVNNGSTGGGTLTYTIQKIVYGKVDENNTLTLSTPGGANFTGIRFASYGTPNDNGSGSYSLGNCNAANSVATATNSFVGRSTGRMDASNSTTANNNPTLGDPCSGVPKSLAVQAAYSADAATLAYDCTEAGKIQYVLLTVNDGTSTSTAVAQVTVSPAPTATISNVNPTTAARGATVTVTGTNLGGVNGVTVNGATATVSNLTPTGFSFVVPAGATLGTGTLAVTAPCSQTLSSPFTVQQLVTVAPVITTPANNTRTNQDVTISGTAPANSQVAVYASQNGAAFQTLGTFTATAGGTFTTTLFALSSAVYQTYATAQSSGSTVSANSSTVTFTVDKVPPTVAISSSAGASGSTITTTPIPFTVTFSESVLNFAASGVTVSNGMVSGFAGSGTTYTFSVTPTTAGTATTVAIAAGVAQDQAGNGNTASTTYALTYAPITATVWTGALSTDWYTAGNWTAGVPMATVDATIPTTPSSGRFPAIEFGTADVKNLTINNAATLTQANGTLVLAGNLTNNGTYQPTGGTVNLGSTTQSSILGSSNTRFWNLLVGASGAQSSTSASTSVQRLLTLNGSFATNGNPLTLESNAAATALVINNGSNVINGTVTVQRYIVPDLNPNLGYRHVSAPISNATVASLTTGSFTPVVNPAYNTAATPATVRPFPTVYGYDQSRLSTSNNNLPTFDKGWFSPAASTDPLTVGQGYTVNISAGQTWNFVGAANNGIVSQTLNRNSDATAADAGLQLVGNPYPSPLDWTRVAATDRPNVDGIIYVWTSNDPSNPYAGNYSFYSPSGGGIGNVSPVLPLGQAFFVRVTSGQTSGTLNFNNSHRPTTYSNNAYHRTTAETRPLVQLTLKGAGSVVTDDAFVYFDASATNGLDAEYDGLKLANPSGLNLSSSLSATQRLCINGLEPLGASQKVVPLAVGVPAAGSYSLSTTRLLNLDLTPVYLRDLQTGAVIDLRQQPSYQFTVSNASALITNRFELVFSPQQALATAPAALVQQVALYPNPARKAAFVELPASLGRQAVTAALVDALGRVVRTVRLPAQGAQAHPLDLSDLPTGVYALRLSTRAGTIVKRLTVE